MANEIKVAFSGARRAGSFFKAFQSHPETEIVALCDPYAPTLAASGEATGVTQLYNVFETMLDEARPDAVVVSSPMQYHAPQAIAALQRRYPCAQRGDSRGLSGRVPLARPRPATAATPST